MLLYRVDFCADSYPVITYEPANVKLPNGQIIIDVLLYLVDVSLDALSISLNVANVPIYQLSRFIPCSALCFVACKMGAAASKAPKHIVRGLKKLLKTLVEPSRGLCKAVYRLSNNF